MDSTQIVEWLERESSVAFRADLTARYGIPNDNALGVKMSTMRAMAKEIGRDHDLASQLWSTGVYEARILAAFVEEPTRVTTEQMDAWAAGFDSWAICDTVCMHLFDKTPHAWEKAFAWTLMPEEFVRRAGFALFWALSVHDKKAPDEQFLLALETIENAEPDPRPLVKKAIDMALRAIGKHNAGLRAEAMAVAERMAASEDRDRAWIGRHAHRELSARTARGES
jgi:3-methyladenine DNA glycosylase AlkD